MKSLLVLLLLVCTSAWAEQAGKIDFVDGAVRVIDAAGKERPGKVGEAVNEGDTLQTGADGEVHVAMEDGGQIGLNGNSRLRVLKYKAEGGKDDRSLLNLVQGAMRSITGWIGKYNPRNYEIRTPTATIGVRGTDHETRVIPEGSSEGEAGTYDKVNVGATLLRSQYGTTEVRPNQAGFVSHAAQARPRLLTAIPTFFKPMRHAQRFEGLHEKIRQHLDQHRQQRIQQVVEKRKAHLEQRQQTDMRRQAEQKQRGNDARQLQQRRQEQRQKLEEKRQVRKLEEKQKRVEPAKRAEARRKDERHDAETRRDKHLPAHP